MEKILPEIYRIVEKEFVHERYLAFVYGSYAYGIQRQNSDLDLIIIGNRIEKKRIGRMVSAIIDLHNRYGLPIDEEVPFHRKLTATWEDVKVAIMGYGFPCESGKLIATPVTKTRRFLESDEIRLRLLLNAFTGRCVFIGGDAQALNVTQYQARVNWVRILPLLLNQWNFSVSSFVDHLIGTGDRKGEWFLGFKENPVTRVYLEGVFENVLIECLKKRWLVTESDGAYSVTDIDWVHKLIAER